jgi:hypothetical protein
VDSSTENRKLFLDRLHSLRYNTDMNAAQMNALKHKSWAVQNLHLLDRGMCLLKFEKADGTERSMIATRAPRWIPSEHEFQPVDKHGRFVVWDVEIQKYRSFIVDRLISLIEIKA